MRYDPWVDSLVDGLEHVATAAPGSYGLGSQGPLIFIQDIEPTSHRALYVGGEDRFSVYVT